MLPGLCNLITKNIFFLNNDQEKAKDEQESDFNFNIILNIAMPDIHKIRNVTDIWL